MADIASLPDRSPQRVGSVTVDPASRYIVGPDGRTSVEPRVMRLLLTLADAAGGVVTRERIAQCCWQGRFVADDTINNAVAELRRALRRTAGASIQVETIPRTGYRLHTQKTDGLGGATGVVPCAAEAGPGNSLSRRALIGGGALAAAGLTLATGWRPWQPGRSEVEVLIEDGAQALRSGLPESGRQAAGFLQAAVSRAPDNSKALGLLAIAYRTEAEYAEPTKAADALTRAEAAARRALAIDPRQSDAHVALATLTPSFGHWSEAEQRIRAALAIDTANPFANGALATLLMSTGQVRACLERLEWLHRNAPLSANVQFRRIYTLWSAGRSSDMDRVADMAMQAWPSHSGVWFARMWTLTFTQRVGHAIAMVGDPVGRPRLPAAALQLLSISLRALQSGEQADVRRAIAANLAAAPLGPSQSISATMVLSSLGAATLALDVAKAYLARQGPMIVRSRHSPAQPSLPDQHHRMAMMLWIPATRALRETSGFRSLCDSIGLMRYWQESGNRPDAHEDLVTETPQA